MSKRTHQKELARARERRRAATMQRRQRRIRLIAILLIAGLGLSMFAVALLGQTDPAPVIDDGEGADPGDIPPELAQGPCPPPDDTVPAARQEPYDEPPRFDVDPAVTYQVRLVTTCGDIVIEVDTAGAPRTAENFLALAADGYYNGTPFHRVQRDFVAQGGDPAGTGTGCMDPECEVRMPGYQLEDELDSAEALPASDDFPGAVEYPRGTVAMANSGPDTQGGQFFVVQADPGYPFQPAYTIVGRVVAGMEVVDDIVAGPVDGDRAIQPVVILEAHVTTS